MKNKGFTLAEVLIVTGVIGIVAALTIPPLINKISTKAKEAQTKTIEARLLDGINRYSTMEDGLSKPYKTTKEFLDGLSKYYKMNAICDSDEITNCIPYSKILYETESENTGVKTIGSTDVSVLTRNINLMPAAAANNYLPPASFISAQGTPVIIALKKGCIWDSGKAMTSIKDSECISLMYDKNGNSSPNKFGDDIVSMGLTPNIPIKTINGIKVLEKAFFPTKGLTREECEAEIPKEADYLKQGFTKGITSCVDGNNDKWSYVMKHCYDIGGHLPNVSEAHQLVRGLFKDENGKPMTGNRYSDYTLDTELAKSINLKNTSGKTLTQENFRVFLWTHPCTMVYVQGGSEFNCDNYPRNWEQQAICIGK